jgi:hypothetical protein
MECYNIIRDTEQKCITPSYYSDSLFQGFRGSHWIVGGCTQDYGSMTLMPLSGSLRCGFSRQQQSLINKTETTVRLILISVSLFLSLLCFGLFLRSLILRTTESSCTNGNTTRLNGKNIFAHNEKMMLICSQ